MVVHACRAAVRAYRRSLFGVQYSTENCYIPYSLSLVTGSTRMHSESINLILVGMYGFRRMLQGMLKQWGRMHATTPTITAAVTAGQQTAAIVVCGVVGSLGVPPAASDHG